MNVPVEPLLRATERAPLANASPEFLLVLLSVLAVVEVNVSVAVLLLSVVLVFVLTLLSVGVFVVVLLVVLVLVLPFVVVWSLETCANAALLKPNARAMAEAMSDFFMEPPEVVEVELITIKLRCVTANRHSDSNIGASPSPHPPFTQAHIQK